MPAGDGRPKVSVVTWSVNHNPIGRAHVLAEVLARDFEVELVGFEFPAFPPGVWEPIRGSSIPVRSYAGTRFPEQLDLMQVVGRKLAADAVVVSKPRIPGFGLGVLAKEARNVPLVVDVDDLELSFVGAERGVDLDDLDAIAGDPTVHDPYGRVWTQVCDHLVRHADAWTVSNHSLADRFGGGTLVPHARDQHRFDPCRFDRRRAREELGIDPDVRLVLFGGTARRHKGIVELAGAVADLGADDVRLCVFDTHELRELRDELESSGCGLVVLPPQPFERMPLVLAAADVTAVLQDASHPISQHQMPAKVTDALAMQVPCLVNRVPPLVPLIEGGHLEEVGPDGLAPSLARLFGRLDEARATAAANRDLFLAHYSTAAVANSLCELVWRLLDDPPPLAGPLRELLAVQRRLFASATSPPPQPHEPAVAAGLPLPRPRPRARGGRFDLVVFWKQNDSGLYGRRSDMFVEALAHSEEVAQVIQFDAPLGVEQLRTMGQSDVFDQSRLVFDTTVRRVLGQEHRERISRHTFLYDDRGDRLDLPRQDQFGDFVEEVLAEHRREDRDLVFWVYPTNPHLPELIDRFMPHVVVADIVDDNRTWYPVGSDAYDRLTDNYREVLRRSDVALANCEPVRRSMAPLHAAIELVPNACEPDGGVFPAGRPRELEGLVGPVVGYVGNLSSRVDIPLLERMARERPDWNLVLVGSTHAGTDVLTLAQHPNVVVLGPRRYEEAKQFIDAFDVAVIPHLVNDMTESMNPLKAFVYCSIGVPVVSTEVANLDALAGLVTVADTHEEFIARVDKAISVGRQPLTDAQRRILETNSWTVRAERALELISQARCAGA